MTEHSLSDHLELALEYAENEEAIFHLRQALQLLEVKGNESDA